jgi:pimeloyl-ACP methyl ester carboxylesterase
MYLSMGRRHDYRSALHNIHAPALVIHGNQDLQPEKASRMYADNIPNTRLEIISPSGHFVFVDQPDIFATKVGAFLDLLSQ